MPLNTPSFLSLSLSHSPSLLSQFPSLWQLSESLNFNVFKKTRGRRLVGAWPPSSMFFFSLFLHYEPAKFSSDEITNILSFWLRLLPFLFNISLCSRYMRIIWFQAHIPNILRHICSGITAFTISSARVYSSRVWEDAQKLCVAARPSVRICGTYAHRRWAGSNCPTQHSTSKHPKGHNNPTDTNQTKEARPKQACSNSRSPCHVHLRPPYVNVSAHELAASKDVRWCRRGFCVGTPCFKC